VLQGGKGFLHGGVGLLQEVRRVGCVGNESSLNCGWRGRSATCFSNERREPKP
jgi:hypothetical protein